MTQTPEQQRPQPREDGSYELPAWAGRWWAIGPITDHGMNIVHENGGLRSPTFGLPVSYWRDAGLRWYPVQLEGLAAREARDAR